MKLTIYPHGITASSAEFDGNPQCQGGVFERFKALALYLKSNDKGTAAAAAIAIRQLADTFGCAVEFIGNMDDGYEVVRIESRQQTASEG